MLFYKIRNVTANLDGVGSQINCFNVVEWGINDEKRDVQHSPVLHDNTAGPFIFAMERGHWINIYSNGATIHRYCSGASAKVIYAKASYFLKLMHVTVHCKSTQ